MQTPMPRVILRNIEHDADLRVDQPSVGMLGDWSHQSKGTPCAYISLRISATILREK